MGMVLYVVSAQDAGASLGTWNHVYTESSSQPETHNQFLFEGTYLIRESSGKNVWAIKHPLPI